ncbi:MAG: transposase [Pirellulales bacterium]|nr:transposase [Pirellulales bacterium]
MVAAVTGFPARGRRRPHGSPAASRRYERRRPEKTPLHRIISENLESWLEWREAAERPVPGYVEEELRGYLQCGLLCFGFARARCTGCGKGFVVAFSCKGRGVCPSCNGRHMAQTAAHLADHVIPPVPVRQWVISVPKRLRGFLADRPRAVAAVTRIFLDEIERTLITASGVTAAADTPRASLPRLGGISFLHRFGSALNHHVHLHACVTDGVFMPPAAEAGCDAPPAFLPARPITPADLAALTERVRRRVIRWFRLTRLLDAAAAADILAWKNSGFSVDASVRITLLDRNVPSYFRSLEHLLRYCARPPFALERLSVIRGPDGQIARIRYVLPRHKAANWVRPGRKSTRPGATGVVELSPFEFLDRLADLVPPPRKHRHRYHGVFAPNHRLRRAVTALAIGNIAKPHDAGAGGHAGDGHATGGCCDTQARPRSHDTSRIAWAKLMARVGEEFPLECPVCGGDIRLIAFITEPGPIRKILTHLGEPLEPPPVSPARGPPTDWGELVQIHDDRNVFQASPDELPAIDIHSL